jgi:conflict system STAND superfamily ATPase/sulfatase-modifying factor enzyme 1
MIVAKGMNNHGLVLFLDQMEELFTTQTKDNAKPFLSVLYSAASEGSIRVIATIRSDFLHYCHSHPEMLKVLNGRGHYALGRVEPFMIHEMIKKPAACAALIVPDRLVSRLVQDTGSEPGNLPLLAFVLQRLFDKRSGNVFDEAVYDALGGVAGAISDHIKTVEEITLAKKIGRGALDLLPRLFQSLLVVNEEGQSTRRRAPIEKFPTDLRGIVDILVTERLLSTEGEGETATVSVAHEKLFEVWPALAKWIGENQTDLFILRQAEIEASEWEKHACDLRYLWHVDRLKQLQEIVQRLSDRTVDPSVASYASPQHKLIKRLEQNSLSHQDRLMIGSYLAALGDPRPGVGLRNGLPDIDWVEIPLGRVRLVDGTRVFTVEPFRIARYLVTNIQFEAFINADDGYRKDQWWRDIERNHEPGEPAWNETNCPRETVSWYEAIAFCRWLSLRLGSTVRLPTEWEWQQAATGGDAKRKYPWSEGWDSARCNGAESRLNRTLAVGVYPKGATAQGVLDMAGNVWEWCLNKHSNPTAAEIDASFEPRVIRGGSWAYHFEYLHSSYRTGSNPGGRGSGIGFRLAQDID